MHVFISSDSFICVLSFYISYAFHHSKCKDTHRELIYCAECLHFGSFSPPCFAPRQVQWADERDVLAFDAEKVAEWPWMTGWPQWFDACCSSSPGESRQRQRQAAPPAASVPRRHTGHCSCRGLHQVWQVPDRRDRWGGSYWLERLVRFNKALLVHSVIGVFRCVKMYLWPFLTLGFKECCSGFEGVRRKALKAF